MDKNRTFVDDSGLLDDDQASLRIAAKGRAREWTGLSIVLVVATAFRVSGLTWGLPNANHLFSYHPDETVMLLHSLPAFGSLNLFSNEWFKYVLPHFYNYGSLQLYLLNIASSLASAYNLIGPVYTPDGTLNAGPIGQFYLLGRSLTAVMGILTVWAVWSTARLLWGRTAAFWSALLLAVMPLQVQHSHFLTVDVPATLWVTLSLYWSARILKDGNPLPDPPSTGAASDRKTMRHWPSRSAKRANPWVMAGLFAGLATATKYNAALVIFPLLAAGHFRRDDGLALALKGAATGILAFVIAFIIGCPGAVFDTKRFLADVRYEGNHVYRHGEPMFQHTGPGWLSIAIHNLLPGMGGLLFVVVITAIIVGMWRHKREEMLLLSFAIPYYALVSAAQSRYARYEIPLLPVFALLIGMLIHLAQSRMGRRADGQAEQGDRPVRRAAFVCALAAAAWVTITTAIWTVNLMGPMMRTDPRDEAVAQYGMDRSKTFGFATVPWFYSPPMGDLFNLPGPGQWLSMRHRWDFQHLLFAGVGEAFNADYLRRSKPDIVFLSEFEYGPPLRLGDQNARDYLSELRRDYNGPIPIGRPAAGVRVTSVDGLPVQALPHDMLYTNPEILVFTRRP